jgi:glyoxylase-like metal-dependent hydrolase (beta-lactamase superfamily II)
VREGLWRIHVPMPGDHGHVSVFLVATRFGWMLLDAGVRTPEARAALARGLEETGVAPVRIHSILLTHRHLDHAGLAAELRESTGAPVFMHPADAALIGAPPALEAALESSGAPAGLRQAVIEQAARMSGLYPSFTPDRGLEEGMSFESELGAIEVIHTPGHSPGHCSLFAPAAGILLSGDAAIRDVRPYVGWQPGRDSFGEMLATLGRLAALPPVRVVPSHGPEFTGLPAWAASARAHYEKRLRKVERLHRAGLSPHEIVCRVWRREWSPFGYRLALMSVLACLAHREQIPAQQQYG